MKIVATVVDAREAALASELGPDLLEVRMDLMDADPGEEIASIRSAWRGPVILTNRSAAEGGMFRGDPGEWWNLVSPLLPLVDLVDVERPFSPACPEIRRQGKRIIASLHTDTMPSPGDLSRMALELRRYGDIPKIVVRPGNRHDLLVLLKFTLDAGKPICTGVLGDEHRYARVILPLFGSEFAYTHMGTPAAPGQYSLGEFREILDLLRV
ncbi:MAG TPA: type I 3-dehydroquinate dehydratase [Methanomicrobiales archaeon]|nr:type I 3-dehydroquinate dehydratase [Methanomicrobiales archaeon]